ncbi:hypothetical protein C1645_834779 [Glomus cerebriforme]|uniref:BTB/POZ domain-containing protein n=1 Tax=Glomus cerebriforme TaxID=658196 RepID=A0A397SD49_9GLOM|nr:hypothetical protein C1645_834779 [Glomus cerebriforme]
MSFEYPQDVVNDLETLLENDEGYDVIIHIGENENVKEIHAHSNILRVRSQYFRKAFSNEFSEIKVGKFILKIPNISPQSFEMILRFIYCGKIDLEKLQGIDILKLLIAVDELNIQFLTHHIQKYLIEHRNEFLQQNLIEILEISYQREIFIDLLNISLKKICDEPEILFNSDKFINLKGSLLESLFKRDDLLLDEIDIWDILIKWCLAQNSNISHDVTQWNKDEITIMKRTIHRFIPLVRFYYISSENFITKVYPFNKLIPKDLINKILIFYLASNMQLNEDIRPPRQSKCNVDSLIINQNYFAIFANWIYRKKKISEYIPYKFNLLYRASRDGNTNVAFHEKCDNKGATIVIVKVANSKQIVGGYNPLSWDSSNKWISTYDSFVFSFTDENDLSITKVGYSYGDTYSIGCHSNNGPIFGNGRDFNFWIDTWYSDANSSYPNVGMPAKFKADEYEIFQVIKK